MPHVQELVDLLRLEAIGVNRFRGHCQDLGFKNLFGGQVLGQSLSAASQTLPEGEWAPHSLHAYFLRPGNVVDSIEFEVDCVRDGRSFAMRQITASQNGKAILTMMASFQHPEEGFEHQDKMPDVQGPEGLASQLELTRMFKDKFPERLRDIYTADKPIEIRAIDPINIFAPKKQDPIKYVWMKTDAPLADDAMLHAHVLTYATDFNLIGTSMMPHGVSFAQRDMQVASLDHAIWFHRPIKFDDWLLYALDSPSASSGRGLSRGQLFNRQGELVASVAQEGLIRQIEVKEKE
ncbi:MAG: acyl-CoA thioesterase II [Oleispira sp.]|nr:acyl-CoA thioesterase II [Oleispira sp.]MBL4880263.1 acyl-CoA thioesterase II [Oleispira sp.]